MDNLLRQVYINRRCNACGGTFRVTLHDALMENRVQREWQPARPCSVCSADSGPLRSAVPAEALEGLESAWENVRRAAEEAGLELQFGV